MGCKPINAYPLYSYLIFILLVYIQLALHLCICITSLIPFFFTGKREYGLIPVSVWLFYNLLFMIGSHSIAPIINLKKFKRTFKAAVEEFFSPRLIPVLSITFLLVPLSLSLTGRTLKGPPLCFQRCGVCLSKW